MNKENCNKPLSLEFLMSWSGNPFADGVEPKFVNADGTSLNSGQLQMLKNFNVPVVRPKGPESLKIFVLGSDSRIYSTIIARQYLQSLSYDFEEHGVGFSVSVRQTYGLKHRNNPLSAEFLMSWSGNSSVDGVKPKFVEVERSDLDSDQLKMLGFNVPIVHPEGPELLKVFFSGPNSKIYSIIIASQDLRLLSEAVKECGVAFSISVRQAYGLD